LIFKVIEDCPAPWPREIIGEWDNFDMQGRFLYNWPDSEASSYPKKGNFGGGELAEAVSVDAKKCVGCGQCFLVCDFNALEVRYGLSKVKRENCVTCGVCLEFCPLNALGWERA